MSIKKFFASILLILSVFITSCASNLEMPQFLYENTGAGLEGVNVKFAWNNVISLAYYEIDTPQYDYFINRIRNIEETSGCTIEVDMEPDMDSINVQMMAGSYAKDLLLTGITNLAENKNVYPLTDFSDMINLNDEKYGGVRVLEAAMYNGVPYGVMPVMWPGFQPAKGYVIAYNRTLFQENGVVDLHEYYENETWTYDTFENEFIAKTRLHDANGNLITTFSTHSTDFYQCLMFSNDVKYTKVNSDGTVSADPFSPSFRRAAQWGQNLFKNYGDVLDNDTSTHDQVEYRNQQTLTVVAYDAQIVTGNIAYNDVARFETGVMPFPCGPDATYGEWGQFINELYGFGIPVTAKEPEAAAYVIDKLCEPFEEFGGYDGLFDYYTSNIFSKDLDAEIFIATHQNPRYTYIGAEGSEMEDVRERIGDIIVSGTGSLTEAYTQMESKLQYVAEKYIIPNYEAVYGDK